METGVLIHTNAYQPQTISKLYLLPIPNTERTHHSPSPTTSVNTALLYICDTDQHAGITPLTHTTWTMDPLRDTKY